MKTFFTSLLSAGLLLAQAASGFGAEKPNFLFIYTDDQRWDALGVVQREMGEKGRFPWFRTPNMDRLASEGVRFRNAFVTSSLCSPSRAAFLTGQYNHINGVANNHTPFPTNSVTYASVLRAAGYMTGYIGKWHMGNQRGQRPGFDFSASFVGQGQYQDCPVEINGVSQPTHGWVDDVTTASALEFICSNRSKPFLLVVGFKSPHDPRTPPDRWKGAFSGEAVRPVPNLQVRAPYLAEHSADRRRVNAATNSGPAPDHLLDYFRCIAAADENVGRLLAALDELGLADNTMVVCSSDNGYYFGEHGLGDKRSAYDESLRIPLLLRYPKLVGKGRVVEAPVLNIDLAPTFLDYAGLKPPAQMQGRSWRSLLATSQAASGPSWRDSFFYEYFFERRYAGTPTLFAVRTWDAKLIRYQDHDEWTEVFDLAKDPYELKNLRQEPAGAELYARLDAEYARQQKAVRFAVPADADRPGSEAPAEKALNACVLDYQFEHDQGDEVRDASGKGNHGHANQTALADGRNGRKARRFDGDGCIEVPRAPSLNPAVGSWRVEITFKADAPDGVLLAQGGANFGYCLALQGGRPVFTVTAQKQQTQIVAKDQALGAWITVRAGFTASSIFLASGAAPEVRAPLPTPITREPREPLQIGDDLGTPVMGEKKPPPFKGLIESVRIYSGQ